MTSATRRAAMAVLAVMSLLVIVSTTSAFQPGQAMLRAGSMGGQMPMRCPAAVSASGVAGAGRGAGRGEGRGAKIVMMAKKKLTPAQQAALDALSKFETGAVGTGLDPNLSALAAPVVMKKEKKKKEKKQSAEDTDDDEDSDEASAKAPPPPPQMSKKKSKKGLMDDMDDGAGYDDGSADMELMEEPVAKAPPQETNVKEVAAPAPPAPKEVVVASAEEEDEEDPDWKKQQRERKDAKKDKKKKGPSALDELGLGDVEGSLEHLFGVEDEDSRRAGKKGKKDKKDKKDKGDAVVAKRNDDDEDVVDEDAISDPNAETLEQKVKKNRPPGSRVRIETGSQPGFVSVRLDKVNVIFKNQQVCTDCSWGVTTGDRVGLVGANGGGKTTQLRVMYGELEPTSGEVIKSSSDLRISFLRQEFVDELVMSRTLKEELMSVFGKEMEIMSELDNMENVLTEAGTDADKMQVALDRMQELQEMADAKGVTQLASKVEKIMDLMGFSVEEGENLVASFSGGWKMRIGLGKILLTEPNLLLLDEPTNHLDLESIEWMEQFLINQKIPMVIVSHDREFLDRVCTKTVDVDGGTTATYDGNYSRFLKLKKAAREAWQSSFDNQMKKVKADKDFINRFKSGAQAAQAASRQKKLDKFMASDEWIKKPPTEGKPLRFRFPPAPRLGDGYAVVNCKGVGHGYPDAGRPNLFKNVDLNVEKGDRIAILGPNGCGKSTFMRLVAGKEKQAEGSVDIGGENVVLQYYEQNQADVLDLERTVLETMKYAADGRMEYEEIRALLGQFLFKGDTVNKQIGMLSGGEKARVALCTMMLTPANLLVLDEPTNHLDIPAKEMLEEALQNFDGTILVISHDRYFVSQVANTICAFEDREMVRYNGDYKFYMEKNEEWKAKVENRYVDGLEGIKALPEIKVFEEEKKKTKNFGGSGVTSGDKTKGVKNAKRQGD